MQIVVFQVGLGAYALPVEHVSEIVPYRAPRSLPAGAPWELGVISLREQVVPVWELATRLGLPAREPGPGTVLVLADGDDPVALIVDGVGGIHDLADGAFESLALFPEAFGVAHLDDELVVVLDADRLLGRTPPVAPVAPAAPAPTQGAAAPPDSPPPDLLDGLTKRELERRARVAVIPGRSSMDRAELIAALRDR
jgi:purine-binding chemotaxis protein CheW